MQNSKASVLICGAITVAMGAVGILAGLGLLPKGQGDPAIPMVQQQAVAICIGGVFAAGGASAMLTVLPGRASHIAKGVLAFVVVVGLTSLLGWVAVGPGSRGFSSPLAILGPQVNELSGRIMFGLGALLGLLIAIMMIRDARRSVSTRSDQGLSQ